MGFKLFGNVVYLTKTVVCGGEEWPDYEVDRWGHIWSIKGNRIKALKTWDNGTGYLCCSLSRPGKVRISLLHRLIAETYLGAPAEGMEIRHLNGDPSDNRPANLAWGTKKENEADKVLHGTACRGQRCHSAKLTAAQVRDIYLQLLEGASCKNLAELYGVHSTLINQIKKKRIWRWLKDQIDLEISQSKKAA